MTVAVKKLNNLLDSRKLSGEILNSCPSRREMTNATSKSGDGYSICAGQCRCCNSIGGRCNCSSC